MREKITLPVSGLEVELAVMSWEEGKNFFQRAQEFLADAQHSPDEWMEQVLERHYPQKVIAQVMVARPDALELYNDTVRYNLHGPKAIKNSSRSGTGAPTQTETSSAAPARQPTTTE